MASKVNKAIQMRQDAGKLLAQANKLQKDAGKILASANKIIKENPPKPIKKK